MGEDLLALDGVMRSGRLGHRVEVWLSECRDLVDTFGFFGCKIGTCTTVLTIKVVHLFSNLLQTT